MGPGAVMDALEKIKSLVLTGNRTLGRPARIQSHYTDYAIPSPFLQCIILTCMFTNRHT
jgi:hypothetical protein